MPAKRMLQSRLVRQPLARARICRACRAVFAAEGDTPQARTISVTETSIKIGDVELRKGPPHGKYRYISLAAAAKALGPVTEKYGAGRIIDYARPGVGIHLQEDYS